MTRLAATGLGVLLALLLGALLLLRSQAAVDEPPGGPPELLEDLTGQWTVTVKTREAETSDWQEFRTAAVIEPLFEGQVLRERSPQTDKPWRELAYTRWDAHEQAVSFEHVFSGSLSMLRMTGRIDPASRTIRYRGRWHQQRGEEVREKPASGVLTIESRDRHVWRLDKHREDGSSFVDLEMTYERSEPASD